MTKKVQIDYLDPWNSETQRLYRVVRESERGSEFYTGHVAFVLR